jgi:hypothetical protein
VPPIERPRHRLLFAPADRLSAWTPLPAQYFASPCRWLMSALHTAHLLTGHASSFVHGLYGTCSWLDRKVDHSTDNGGRRRCQCRAVLPCMAMYLVSTASDDWVRDAR